MKIDSKISNGLIYINFNSITHLSFKVCDYIGFQTFIDDELTKYFTIEVYLKGKTVILQYDTVIKMKKVIECLSNIQF